MPQSKAKKAKPVKISHQYSDIKVRDCLVWPDPSQKPPKKGSKEQHTTTYVLSTRGDLGKPTTRNYGIDPNVMYGASSGDDGLHVVDALRGWPHSQEKADAEQEVDILGMRTPLEEQAQKRSAKKTKKPKKKKASDDDETGNFRRSRGLEETGPDPDMVDLISHKYLSEAAEARMRERAAEIHEQQMRIRRERDRKFPKDIKATKTTQLRSLALGEKVEKRPQDLWQMPKFRDNAQPMLNTFRAEEKATNNKTAGNYGYTCTCAEEQGLQTKYSNLHDDEYGEQEITLNDFNGAENTATNIEALFDGSN